MLRVLYASRACSQEKFEELFNSASIKPGQQCQKFNDLLIKGFSRIVGRVVVVSYPPISRASHSKFWFRGGHFAKDNLYYTHLPIINLTPFKQLLAIIFGFLSIVKWGVLNRKYDKVIICDSLNPVVSFFVLVGSFFTFTKNIAVVTDIPDFLSDYSMRKGTIINKFKSFLSRKIGFLLMTRFHSYVFLTESMCNLINPNRKPYTVVEGLVDIYSANQQINVNKNKYDEKVIVYAGTLNKQNGVEKLAKAFMQVDNPEARLWFFGSGDSEKRIVEYAAQDSRIMYFGEVRNEEVLIHEYKATLLVNPRSTEEEFSKYSFPSKNMEYMVSGTPLLTTKLSSMPPEYSGYVYLFEGETIEDMKCILQELLSTDKDKLIRKGESAREFVLREKNNVVQAKKILSIQLKGDQEKK